MLNFDAFVRLCGSLCSDLDCLAIAMGLLPNRRRPNPINKKNRKSKLQPTKPNVKKLAEKIVKATNSDDYATVVDLTYKTVVEMMGGRDNAIVLMRRSMKQVKDSGIEVKTTKLGEVGDFQTQGKNTFVILRSSWRSKRPREHCRVNPT